MKLKIAAALLVLLAASHAFAQSRTLHWTSLAVTAHLDADGRLHVKERHAVVFDGDWNGGERTFHLRTDQVIELDRISRIDASEQVIPLNKDKSFGAVDDYAWTSSNTLRWRSRLPSDPPFEHRPLTYLIEYTLSHILIPESDGAYLIDHDFGLPDLGYPIDAFSVDLTLDPAWQPIGVIPRHITRGKSLYGESVTVTQRLSYSGTGRPAGVTLGAPAAIRFSLLTLLLGGAGFVCWEFWTREDSIGRFKPLPEAASIDRAWLHEHVFKFRPEVVGAAWDDRTGAPEVAAVIARMVQEGKLDSRVEKAGRRGSDLVLTLLRPKDSFDGYEAALVKALFFAGTTTSTAKIKAHYKNSGFDPVAKLRDPLQGGIRDMAGKRAAPKIDRRPTVALGVTGAVAVTLGGFASASNLLGALVTSVIVVAFYVAGVIGAIDYRRRVTNLGLSSLAFVPAAVLILAVPALLLGGGRFRFNTLLLAGLVLIALAAIRSLFNLAKSRDGASRLENRRTLKAARDFFARELRRQVPALDDAWFPYLLAFGLDSDADRWFRSFGGSAAAVSPGASTIGSFGSALASRGSAPDAESSPSGGGAWTGGMGGRSGGAGASGTWAVAVSQLAQGVSAPSSSGSGSGSSGSSGGGSSSSGSSGGGGAGGW